MKLKSARKHELDEFSITDKFQILSERKGLQKTTPRSGQITSRKEEIDAIQAPAILLGNNNEGGEWDSQLEDNSISLPNKEEINRLQLLYNKGVQ